jgi:hypothetical protein
MRQTADAGYTLGQHDGRTRHQALEPLFHTAMLEEQAWLIVQDRFTYVIEKKFRRLRDVGADRAERQFLHVGDGAGYFGDETPVLVDHHCKVGRIIRIEWR